jgi:hypothetical protein
VHADAPALFGRESRTSCRQSVVKGQDFVTSDWLAVMLRGIIIRVRKAPVEKYNPIFRLAREGPAGIVFQQGVAAPIL